MAKRYYESKKSMHKMGAMINEDHAAACLLPTHIIEKEWDGRPDYKMMHLKEDLFSAAQTQLHEDMNDLKKEFKAGKY